jgi:hypothetical protein
MVVLLGVVPGQKGAIVFPFLLLDLNPEEIRVLLGLGRLGLGAKDCDVTVLAAHVCIDFDILAAELLDFHFGSLELGGLELQGWLWFFEEHAWRLSGRVFFDSPLVHEALEFFDFFVFFSL